MTKINSRFMLLPIAALAACGAGDMGSGGSVSQGEFATQLEAPSPDYEEIIANAPLIEPYVGIREPSASLPANAREIGETWIARLEAHDALAGYGLADKGDEAPVQSIDTLLPAHEFDNWVAENGWTAPVHIRWGFVSPFLMTQRLSEAARSGIRYWPASSIRTGAQNQALLGGHVYLRDGCFFVRTNDEGASEKLAWFLAETGLDIDDEGYYVLVNRLSGQTVARLGEQMSWAGPNAVDESNPAITAYRKACGEYEVMSVGNPESNERMYVTYPHLRQAPDSAPPPGIH